jgi:hypothetical protein
MSLLRGVDGLEISEKLDVGIGLERDSLRASIFHPVPLSPLLAGLHNV